MFAAIEKNQEIRESLRYNERKIRAGHAQCLEAGNFIKDLKDLTLEDKRYHFERLTSLNEGVKSPGVHISLSFHPSDMLTNAELVKLSKAYLEKMQFGHQPYLIYRHTDVSHPHVHLVTTTVQEGGERIHVPKSRYYYLQQVSKEMEVTYHLAHSGNRDRQQDRSGRPLTVQYGKEPTMPAISDVLDKVVGRYNYTSVEELNAVLRPYNVEVYRGKEGSRLHAYGGLIYRVLDERGMPTGSQIRASNFDSKPTLKNLEKQFERGRAGTRRQEDMQRVQTAVDWAFFQRNPDKEGLQKALTSERITMVWMRGKELEGQNLYYVDHKTLAAFDGRKLGERYFGKGLEQRYGPTLTPEQQQAIKQKRIERERGQDERSLEL